MKNLNVMFNRIVLGFAFISLTVVSACANTLITGNHQVTKQNRAVSSFDEIEVTGGFEIVLTQSDKESLNIEADNNLLELIETKVNNNVLYISTKNDVEINHYKKMTINLSVKSLRKMRVSGAIDLSTTNQLKTDLLKINISGAANINVDIATKILDVDVSGAGNINFQGQSTDVRMDLSGAGKVSSLKLVADNFIIDVSGVGAAKVYAKEKLNVNISGIGSVSYAGNPKKIVSDISPLGILNAID